MSQRVSPQRIVYGAPSLGITEGTLYDATGGLGLSCLEASTGAGALDGAWITGGGA